MKRLFDWLWRMWHRPTGGRPWDTPEAIRFLQEAVAVGEALQRDEEDYDA